MPVAMGESESWHAFSSLEEFLGSIEGKSFEDARHDVQAEYATVSRIMEEARRARKSGNVSRVNPSIPSYFSELLCLVNAMDGHPFSLDGASETLRQQIESTLKKWRKKGDAGGRVEESGQGGAPSPPSN
jgi:hypothetical protein